jgi:hypothetical protein
MTARCSVIHAKAGTLAVFNLARGVYESLQGAVTTRMLSHGRNYEAKHTFHA